MLKSIRFYLALVLLTCSAVVRVNATHLRAGDITVVRQSCSNYRMLIILHVYTKAHTQVKFGGGTLSFGDNSKPFITATVQNPPIIQENDDQGIGEVTDTIYHDFPGPGAYLITYYEQNRNEGILNITNSVETPFFIQTLIFIDPLLGCDNSPQLLVPPIDQGCTGVKWSHNAGAFDIDGDSLSYALFVPKQARNIDVAGYLDPNAPKFYSGADPQIPYAQANETHSGPPTFEIDPVTGTLTWDSPGEAGEYNVAFRIISWRKIKDAAGINRWVSLGYVERDMQIVIEDCQNARPKLNDIPDVCILAGLPTPFSQDVVATDPDGSPTGGAHAKGDSVKIEAFSQVFSLLGTTGFNPSPAIITPGSAVPDRPVWQPVFDPNAPATITFKWQPSCRDVKDQPYTVIFKATDNGFPIPSKNNAQGHPSLSTFITWNIKVVAPAPQWSSVTLNPGARSATLNWQSYLSNPGTPAGATIQVWRRVDSYPFTPLNCLTGLPSYTGYSLIATLPISQATYLDKFLAPGAEYCYRLVVEFPQPNGGESYASTEQCIGPIKADAPVITNVTVDVTDPTDGKITVKWRSPFQADKTQFPGPYNFILLRADKASGNLNRHAVFPGNIQDSTYQDTGLNTTSNTYNYRVEAYSPAAGFVDSSKTASNVRVELKPFFKEIQLNWSASVPWSNNTAEFPRHLIYRSQGSSSGSLITDLTLYDSVDVNKKQLMYLDTGRTTPLDKATNYCYAVMTRGSYGNPKIAVPLVNFSQINCTMPDDSIPPCKPVLAITATSCDAVTFCPVDGHAAGAPFSNTIQWRTPTDEACKRDIRGYYVYSALAVGQDFTQISDIVTDTFYIDSKLTTYARCYKIKAVDRAGNLSDFSDTYCFDNCPNFILPNVFSPNGDECNEYFSAYNIKRYDPETLQTPCAAISSDQLVALTQSCVRFVMSVDFTVYNRWGKKVYQYTGNYTDTGDIPGSNRPKPGVFIDWDGRDSGGSPLDAGTYYYVANVVFDVVDPKNRNHAYKGWVQIFR